MPVHQSALSIRLYIPPVIEMAMDSFGAKRQMWGSGYPHVAERERYGNCIRLLKEYVLKSEGDQEWIFGKTTTLFRFGGLLHRASYNDLINRRGCPGP